MGEVCRGNMALGISRSEQDNGSLEKRTLEWLWRAIMCPESNVPEGAQVTKSVDRVTYLCR